MGVATGVAAGAAVGAAVGAGALVGSGYTSLDPARLLDTRPDGVTVDGMFEGDGIRGGGTVAVLPGGFAYGDYVRAGDGLRRDHRLDRPGGHGGWTSRVRRLSAAGRSRRRPNISATNGQYGAPALASRSRAASR